MWPTPLERPLKVLALDTEQTIWSKGDPFDSRNSLTCISWASSYLRAQPTSDIISSGLIWVDHQQFDGLFDNDALQRFLECYDIIVGFNLKRDLHWLRLRGGFSHRGVVVFDCQIAEFILGYQRERYPALDTVGARYGVTFPDAAEMHRLWDAGVNTDRIERDVLGRYARQDAIGTLQVFLHQYARINEASERLRRLIFLSMEDMLAIEEMEWNGVSFDLARMEQGAEQLQKSLAIIDDRLAELTESVPVNWSSNDHISAVLYGGALVHHYTVEDGVFKTGARAGQPKFRHVTETITMPRLVKPRKRVKKEGYYSTDFDTLQGLPATGKAKKIRDNLVERANITKLLNTYLVGIPKKAAEMGWTDGLVHGKYNQCVVVTGRLSSSAPNMQNIDSRVKDYIVSRYAD